MDEQQRVNEVSHAGETRHAFLLHLDDALRPLADPVEIQSVASRILGEYLGVNRVAYFDIRGDDYVVERDYTHGAMPLSGRYPLAEFGQWVLDAYQVGRTLVVEDVLLEPGLSPADRDAHAAIHVAAFIGVPLLKDGQFEFGLTVHSRRPRKWAPQELALVKETAERTWAAVVRARAEAALAQSEEKYRTLFANIDEAFCIGELLYDGSGRPNDRRLLEANPRYHDLVGGHFAVGTTARSVDPRIDNGWFERYHQVISTGVPQRFEHHIGHPRRWLSVYLSRVGGPGSHFYAAVFHDITERRRRESHLEFLAEISRDLMALTGLGPTAQVVAARLGRHLEAAGCAFLTVEDAAGRATVTVEWQREGVRRFVGEHALADLLSEDALALLRDGQVLCCEQAQTDARFNAARFAALDIEAFVIVPVVFGGVWRFALAVHESAPRAWRADEIDLARELTSRIWARLEQVRAEEALRASDERHRALFSQMVGGVAETDLNGRFTSVNRRYCEMVGYTASELLQMRIEDICHAEDFVVHGELVERVIRDRECFEIENRYVRKDGSTVWVHHSVSALTGHGGLPRGITSVSVDITDRKRQEEQVRRGAELLDFLIDRSPTGFYIVDADLCISHMNAESQARAFRNVNPAVGRRLDDAMHVLWDEPLASEIIARFRHTLRTGEPYNSPGLVAERADLSQLESYDWQLQRITMPDGRHAVVCYYYDTTRMREAEQSLREADRRKDEFLATLAHELRNPLAPIRNGLHLLKKMGADSPRFPEVHQMMERQLSHLVRLVDDLMEVSRITRGRVELRRERVELAVLIEGAIETSRSLIEAGRHAVELSLTAEPLVLDADPVRLTQVFTNLLNNAARYTEAGGRIAVATRREGATALVSVRDNGQGIPLDMLTRIFDLFIQADPSRSRAHGGLGIGLTLVRAMVGLHQGTVEAHSDGPGQGSEFIVRLPLASGQAAPSA